MNVIGVDFGIGNDIPMVSVIRKVGSKIELLESCKVVDFNYLNYVASEHQIVGEKSDLEKFQIYLKKGDIE